jgi:hypothetical protein
MLKFRQNLMCGNPRVEESSSFDYESRGAETPVVSSAAEEIQSANIRDHSRRLNCSGELPTLSTQIANDISDTGLSTTDIIENHSQVSENQNASMAERIKQKGEIHKVEMRKKKLKELEFLRDNMVIYPDEFAEGAKNNVRESFEQGLGAEH